jgi:hypothetical protein
MRCDFSRAKEESLSWERVVLWTRRQAGRLSYIVSSQSETLTYRLVGKTASRTEIFFGMSLSS